MRNEEVQQTALDVVSNTASRLGHKILDKQPSVATHICTRVRRYAMLKNRSKLHEKDREL
jgi:hypothetical protein